MRTIDWIALGFAAFTAVGGLRRGLVGTALSLAGLVVGALVGARVAPHWLHGGADSAWAPLVTLGGAVGGVLVGKVLGGFVGGFVHGGLRLLPPLRMLDSAGGLAAGAAWGLALVWVAGAVALQLPKDSQVRTEVRNSQVLQRLDRLAPPADILKLHAHLGDLPTI
jgi:uncharacterized membrane protein required for colicin V production